VREPRQAGDDGFSRTEFRDVVMPVLTESALSSPRQPQSKRSK
jgi:hypothetical protein